MAEMNCPYCQKRTRSRVVDTRPTPDQKEVMRKRVCKECNNPYPTVERYEANPPNPAKRKSGD